MNHTRLWAAATILAIIIATGFLVSVPHTRDIAIKTPPPTTPSPTLQVTLHDVFKKGSHTITGSLMAPNACTSVTASAKLVGTASSTQHIEMAISMPEDSGICLQEESAVNFSTTIVAPVHLPIQVQVNGSVATITNI